MKQLTIKPAAVILFVLVLIIGIVGLPIDQADAARRIIRDSSVSKDYQPGVGNPIGEIRRVSGRVFIMHQDMGSIYSARKNLKLYPGDTVTTKSNGKISFVMNDDSVMTLAPNTTMVLNESVFDPAVKRRTSLINLISGKARFFVKKFADFQHSTFKVRTKTSIAAVRGSDFIIEQVGDRTIITTMDLTVLEVTNTDFPLAQPITVSSFQQLVVAVGELTGNPFDVTEDELRNILNDLGVSVDEEDSDDDDGGDDGSGDDDGGDDDSGDDDGSGNTGYGQPGDGSFDDTPLSPSSP